MGGLAGFLVTGAAGGAGQGAGNYFAQQQQAQNAFNNASNLAQLNAGLEVQKQAGILAMQHHYKMASVGLDDNGQPIPGWGGVSSDGQAQIQAQPTAPVLQNTLPQPDVTGLDVNKMPDLPDSVKNQFKSQGIDPSSPQAKQMFFAALSKKDPNAFANGVSDFSQSSQQLTKPSVPAFQNVPTAVMSPSGNSGWVINPKTGVLEPSLALRRAEVMNDFASNGSGVKVLEANAPTDIEKLIAAKGRYAPDSDQAKAIDAQITKMGYIAPTSIRGPGYIDPKTNQFVATPTQAVQDFSKAQESGKNSAEPFGGYDKDGNPLPTTNKTQAATGQTSTGQAIYSTPIAGQSDYLGGVGQAAAKRANDLRNAASESPMRVNVLDNLLRLSSQKGVATGPGADWQNQIKGTIANLPGVRDTSWGKNWQGGVSDYQEFSKFAMQNALRNWQAAGGSGTDAQLEASIEANINNHLFPQAVQQIAEWNKGSELALQAKANAQDNWLKQNGNSPQSQEQFERSWRNNMDQDLFQLKAMNPQEAQAVVDHLKSTPAGLAHYNDLLNKSKAIQQMSAQ